VGTRDSATSDASAAGLPHEVLSALVRLLREVRYGSIEIVVHEGRVTQIERRERMRFPVSEPPR